MAVLLCVTLTSFAGRRLCALSVVSGAVFRYVWLCSAANPADGPSRWKVGASRPRNDNEFDSTLGYPGEGPRSGPGHARGHRPGSVRSPYIGPTVRIPNAPPSGPLGLAFVAIKKSRCVYLRAVLRRTFGSLVMWTPETTVLWRDSS